MRINYLLILVMLQLSIPMMFQLFKPRPMLLPSSMTAGNHGQEVLHNLRCSQSGDSGALGSTDRTIPNPNPKKLPKVNPFALTKKINKDPSPGKQADGHHRLDNECFRCRLVTGLQFEAAWTDFVLAIICTLRNPSTICRFDLVV